MIENLIKWIEINDELKIILINNWKILFSKLILKNDEKLFEIYSKIFKKKIKEEKEEVNILNFIEYSITNSFSHFLITLFFYFSDKNKKLKIKKICKNILLIFYKN